MLTFTLIAFLAYPPYNDNGPHAVVLGTDMTQEACTAAIPRVIAQLDNTLSVAVLLGVDCIPERLT